MDTNTKTNAPDDKEIIDGAYKSLSLGGAGSAAALLFSGINALSIRPPLPPNTDHHGFTFFTKPDMNMSHDNVKVIRKLAYLTDPNLTSMGNLIRCMFNPVGYDPEGDKRRSIIIDDTQAFMPLSNFLLSMSAPPDIVPDIYTSNAGYAQEQVSWIDGLPAYNGTYTLSLTFANIEGDPITAIFAAWMEYSTRILLGQLLPWPINIVENRIDYQTRIYRFVMDRSSRFIQKVYAPIAAFPVSNPIGAAFEFNSSENLQKANDTITINFQCIGAMYDDPILLEEFNRLVENYNPGMRDNKKGMVKVTGITANKLSKLNLLNYRLYPYISKANELEWYAEKEVHDSLINAIENNLVLPTDAEIDKFKTPTTV